jgi:hypothetical protein
MTARLDNEIGRASIKAAYDHVKRPRVNAPTDGTLIHMAITTRHQTDLIQNHLAQLPAEDKMTVRFEDTIADPMQALGHVSAFCGMPVTSTKIAEAVDAKRSQSKNTEFGEAEMALARHYLHLNS